MFAIPDLVGRVGLRVVLSRLHPLPYPAKLELSPIGKGEIEQKKGQAPQVFNLAGGDDKGGKDGKSVDSLHQLFLNHLLRPKEWSASVDGQTYFAFRREHILALADEAQKILES